MTDSVSLKEWVTLRVEAAEEKAASAESRFNLQFQAAASEVALARETLTTRLETNNGHIALLKAQQTASALAMEKQAGEFARMSEVRALLDGIETRIEDLGLSRSRSEGQFAGGKTLRDIGMIIVGAVISYLVGRMAAR